MKKLIAFVCVLALSTGCSLTGNDNLKCSSTTTANGLTTKTDYDIEYKKDDIKKVTITYEYDQDSKTDGIGTGTDGTTDTGTDTDGIVDGVVGEAVDEATDTILDITNQRTKHQNQITNYNNVEGFTSKVDTDTDDKYKIVYTIDFDKISDADLALFNIDRDLTTTRTDYETQGLTCK